LAVIPVNKRQKIVLERFLDNEEAIIKRLDQVYSQSLKDITKRVSELDGSIDALRKAYDSVTDDEIGELAAAFLKKNQHLTPDEARETLQSMIQSKVYQKNYQTALKKQVGDILDTMHEKEFKEVSEYLEKCYEDGFIGTMYDLQGQGIPMCFPLDQEAMVRAVQLDSKISQGLYTRLGEDVAVLKKKITAEVSRGVATAMSYQQVARQLASQSNIGYNNAVRIARTEGHRVQVQSGMDACYKAKDKGADVVKQWDAALDKRTRDSHAAVDGEIRELDEKFSNGLRFPGDPHGPAAEVINCRCALLQRARWALDDGELQTLKDRAAYFGLDKADTFDEYKKTYLKAAGNTEKAQAEDNMTKAGFKRISGKHDYVGDTKAVNPNYYEGAEYQQNCSHTVAAYEMRRRGYDVAATGAKNNDKYMAAGMRAWGFADHDSAVRSGKVKYVSSKRSANIAAEIEDVITKAGDGARFEIRVGWKSGGGHFFVGENINGKATFIDPQNGEIGASVREYLNSSKPSATWYFRIDDIELDPGIMKDLCEVK
jgi:hypothetical protein